MQHSRCGLARAEWRGRITSLDLLPMLFLLQPKIPVAFLATRTYWWCVVSLFCPRTPRSFCAELLSSSSAPSLSWCRGLFLPRCRTLHFPACQGPSERQHSPLLHQPLLPVLHHHQLMSQGLPFSACTARAQQGFLRLGCQLHFLFHLLCRADLKHPLSSLRSYVQPAKEHELGEEKAEEREPEGKAADAC